MKCILVVNAILILTLQGCASTQAIESRQLAWEGPGAGPCLFGGVTPRSAQHCTRVVFGEVGRLQIANLRALADLPSGAGCTEHARAVEQILKAAPENRTQRVYTCPVADRIDPLCHVSILVTTGDGQQYVLDNGAVLRDAPARVATLATFSKVVGDRYWVGQPPSTAQVLDLDHLFSGLELPVR